jgi:hypothetical protein
VNFVPDYIGQQYATDLKIISDQEDAMGRAIVNVLLTEKACTNSWCLGVLVANNRT